MDEYMKRWRAGDKWAVHPPVPKLSEEFDFSEFAARIGKRRCYAWRRRNHEYMPFRTPGGTHCAFVTEVRDREAIVQSARITFEFGLDNRTDFEEVYRAVINGARTFAGVPDCATRRVGERATFTTFEWTGKPRPLVVEVVEKTIGYRVSATVSEEICGPAPSLEDLLIYY